MSDMTLDHSRGGWRCRSGRTPWKPLELAAMIVGFVFFWPVGLTVLGWKLNWFGLRDRLGDRPFAALKTEGISMLWSTKDRTGRFYGQDPRQDLGRDSGNSAFEEYKAAELKRLEEEVAALVARQRAFEGFLLKLREAKDREEFERFMANGQMETTGKNDGATS